MQQLTSTTGNALKTLETSTIRNLALQTNATRSAIHLTDTLAQLTVDTQDNFSKINQTVAELQRTLEPPTSWLKTGLFKLMEVALRGGDTCALRTTRA